MKRGKIAERGKSAAKKSAKPDHYTPDVLREIYARNPWMPCADGVSFDEGEKVNYGLETGLFVKAGTPDSVPLGEVVLFVPPTDGRGAFAAIFTSDEFHREYTLKGKLK